MAGGVFLLELRWRKAVVGGRQQGVNFGRSAHPRHTARISEPAGPYVTGTIVDATRAFANLGGRDRKVSDEPSPFAGLTGR